MAKVLLVEDDNNLREIYQARLTAEGYEIIAAPDGEAALSLAKQHHPDLIISDVMMPRISGFEMLDILRNTDELKHTKVIMLTALGATEDRGRGDNLGADRYLVKSQVTLEDIVNAAKQMLGEDTATPLATPAEPSATPEISLPAPEPTPVATPAAVEPAAPAPDVNPLTQPAVPVAAPVAEAPELNAPAETATPEVAPLPPMPEVPVAETAQDAAAPAPAASTPEVITPATPAVDSLATAPASDESDEPVASEPLATVPVFDPDPLQPKPVVTSVSPVVAPPADTAPETASSTPELMQHSTPQFDVPTTAPIVDNTSLDTPNAPSGVITPSAPDVSAPAPTAEPTTAAIPVAEAPAALSLSDEQATVNAQIQQFEQTPATATPAVDPVAAGQNDALIQQAVEELTSGADDESPLLPPSQVTVPTNPQPESQDEEEATDTIDTLQVEEVPAEPIEIPAPVVTEAPAPTETDNVTVAGKKIIQPISSDETKPDLDVLLAKEAAKEEAAAAEAPKPPVVNGEQAPKPNSGIDPNTIAL